MRTRPAFVFVALLFTALLAPSSHGQRLDDTWFKLTVNVNGIAVTSSSDVAKAKGKFVAYMDVRESLVGAPEGFTGFIYDFTIWSEVLDDVWVPFSIGSFFTVGPDELAMIGPGPGPDNVGVRMIFGLPGAGAEGGGDNLTVDAIMSLKIKTDKQGALKGANLKSLGAVVPEGISEGELLFGGAKIKGKLLDVSKLPFDPGT
jgi:hypothetical protein